MVLLFLLFYCFMYPSRYKNFSRNGSNFSDFWGNGSNFSNSDYYKSFYERAARASPRQGRLAPFVCVVRYVPYDGCTTIRLGRSKGVSNRPSELDSAAEEYRNKAIHNIIPASKHKHKHKTN